MIKIIMNPGVKLHLNIQKLINAGPMKRIINLEVFWEAKSVFMKFLLFLKENPLQFVLELWNLRTKV